MSRHISAKNSHDSLRLVEDLTIKGVTQEARFEITATLVDHLAVQGTADSHTGRLASASPVLPLVEMSPMRFF